MQPGVNPQSKSLSHHQSQSQSQSQPHFHHNSRPGTQPQSQGQGENRHRPSFHPHISQSQLAIVGKPQSSFQASHSGNTGFQLGPSHNPARSSQSFPQRTPSLATTSHSGNAQSSQSVSAPYGSIGGSQPTKVHSSSQKKSSSNLFSQPQPIPKQSTPSHHTGPNPNLRSVSQPVNPNTRTVKLQGHHHLGSNLRSTSASFQIEPPRTREGSPENSEDAVIGGDTQDQLTKKSDVARATNSSTDVTKVRFYLDVLETGDSNLW